MSISRCSSAISSSSSSIRSPALARALAVGRPGRWADRGGFDGACLARAGGLPYLILVFLFVARVYDPAPIQQARLLVFDAYQKLKARVYDPSLPVKNWRYA